MAVKNRIKYLIDALGETRYQFWKKTGLAQNTAYRLYDHPDYIPGRDVIEKLCRTYKWQPGDFIVYEEINIKDVTDTMG
ncbi:MULTISPECIES: helix-turn-helix domain-containing protein [Fischerella]|uniref:XRE family transcriptional regulator n=1 Tax=Fischerella muscicola CCMEE 5323 TaxID=2019572 RepID=A0A2N6K2S1_FISMU|nr:MULTISPECIES: helix-turn-helix transcriptional regulator [Fischerella]PLZ89487.1 XRE family transcriptional regulator [Fischerella muscicola CCMEE 5323]